MIPASLHSATYYFDTNTHTWMNYYSDYPNPQSANVSNNTMGGLHILSTEDAFDPTVIPLSAHNFIVIGDQQAGPSGRTDALVKTIVATDPAVATPWSTALQTQAIQSELTAYPSQKSSITVTSPSGGEQLVAGQKYVITWSSSGLPLSDETEVDLIDNNSNSNAYTLNENSPVSLGNDSYSWNISTLQLAGQYKIRVLDLNTVDSPTIYAESNSFNIVTP